MSDRCGATRCRSPGPPTLQDRSTNELGSNLISAGRLASTVLTDTAHGGAVAASLSRRNPPPGRADGSAGASRKLWNQPAVARSGSWPPGMPRTRCTEGRREDPAAARTETRRGGHRDAAGTEHGDPTVTQTHGRVAGRSPHPR